MTWVESSGLVFDSTHLPTQVPRLTTKNVVTQAFMSYLGLWTWDLM